MSENPFAFLKVNVFKFTKSKANVHTHRSIVLKTPKETTQLESPFGAFPPGGDASSTSGVPPSSQ